MPSTTKPSYFGGSASNFGSVQALNAKTFRQLIEGTLMLARRLGTTRQEFLSMDKKQRDGLKRTAFLIAASMENSPSERLYKETRSIRLVFLDIDDPAHARPLVDNPGLLTSMLEPFSFALYTTANHTKENPRLRLVVDAEISKVKDYPAAVETVAALVGVPYASTESKVSVQPMYLPVVFKDEDPDIDHPLLHYRSDGTKMMDEHIDPTLENRAAGHYKKKSTREGEDGFVDALEFLSEPVDGMTLEEAEEIIQVLDPDLPYKDWISVCFALKHQFGGKPEEEDALDLFDLWSSGGKKYTGRKDVLVKWKSARTHGDGRAPVTMRTVMRLATARGWKGETDFLDGVESTGEIEKALRGIAAAGLSPVDEEAALLRLAKASKKSGISFSLSFLRGRLKRDKQLSAALEAEARDEPPPAWARGFVHVGAENVFHRYMTGEQLSPDSLDAQFGRFLLEKAGIGDDDPSLGSRPPVRPRDYLLNVLKIPCVYGTTYEPRKAFDHIVEQEGKSFLNIYTPSWPDPDEAKIKSAEKAILKHLDHLILEPEYRETLLDFLTFQVQKPGEKVRWAVLLQGAQGCGKTLLHELMAAVLGRRNVKAVEANVLFSSQFNDWATGSQVVSFEEIRVIGHNRHEVMNRLKPCITNSRVSVNRKFYDVFEYENVTNYMLFTNFRDSLAVADGDRRYFVLRSPMQSRKQVLALGVNYFKELFKEIYGNAGGMRAWLESREISENFDPDGHAPRTKYFEELVGASATEEASTIQITLKDSISPLISDSVVDSSTLLAALEMEGIKVGGQRLASILREEGFENAGRRFLNGHRRTLWAKPDLIDKKGLDRIWSDLEETLNNGVSPEEAALLG